jgi:arsenate reductase
MKNILYHNPNCTKSRATLALVNEKKLDVKVIEYLKDPPSVDELEFICEKLNIEPLKIIRTNEPLFAELGLFPEDKKSNREWFEIMNRNPVLIERPILVYNGKAAVGRPPENILKIF